jgi:hypothetical protein
LPLFAENGGLTITWANFIYTVVCTGLGGAAVYCVNLYFKIRDKNRKEDKEDHRQRRTEDKEDENSIIAHWEKLNARMDAKNAELEKKIEVVSQQYAKAISHVAYLEGVMEVSGIKFRRFADLDKPVAEITHES